MGSDASAKVVEKETGLEDLGTRWCNTSRSGRSTGVRLGIGGDARVVADVCLYTVVG